MNPASRWRRPLHTFGCAEVVALEVDIWPRRDGTGRDEVDLSFCLGLSVVVQTDPESEKSKVYDFRSGRRIMSTPDSDGKPARSQTATEIDGNSPAADAPAAIDVEGLELVYSDGTTAVQGLDLTIPEGEFFGFLGPNGAGKTTTIKIFATLLSPTSGTVRVNDFDVGSDARAIRESIGYMAQETSIDPELTAQENIRFACEAYGVPRGQRDNRVTELLDLVDLADVADKRSEEFSGGMKKRLDAATALAHRPALVFLDEPTTGLDPKARNRLWEYFQRINDLGTTIFLTTQYLEEADQLCDRLSVILDGEIVADGSPADLKREVGGEVLDVELDGGSTARGQPQQSPGSSRRSPTLPSPRQMRGSVSLRRRLVNTALTCSSRSGMQS
ncbi:MAG: ABC-type multidrug transport system, ATPase component [Halorubrum sp. J07HR59]|nr:MAG: ABC-type multidrug transport system, ATPase component [Halorubrum sp. J07HR59]